MLLWHLLHSFPLNRERKVPVGVGGATEGSPAKAGGASEQKSLLGKQKKRKGKNPQVKLNLSVFTQNSYAENQTPNWKSHPVLCALFCRFFFLVFFFCKEKKNYKCFAAFGHWRPHWSALSPSVFVCGCVRDKNVSGSLCRWCLFE